MRVDTSKQVFSQSGPDKFEITHGKSWTSSSGVLGIKQILYGSATWDPASIAAGAQATTTITVSGAASGDLVIVSFRQTIANGLIVKAFVTAADTVTVYLDNTTAGAIDPGSGTVRVAVIDVT